MIDDRIRFVAERCLERRDTPTSPNDFLLAVATECVRAGYVKNSRGLPATRLHDVFSHREREAIVALMTRQLVSTDQQPLKPEPAQQASHATAERSLWKEGTFFLVTFVVIVVALVYACNAVTPAALPFVFIGGLVFLLALGFLALRRVRDISQSGLLRGVDVLRRFIPFLSSSKNAVEDAASNKPDAGDA